MNSGDADGETSGTPEDHPSMNTETVGMIGEIVKQNLKVQF